MLFQAQDTSRPCQRCRCPLIMVPNIETRKTLPLDTRASVYLVFEGEAAGGASELVAWNVETLLATSGRFQLKTSDGWRDVKVKGVYVTHFATCPNAREFSHRQ